MSDLGVYLLNDEGDPMPLAECDDDSLGFCLRTLAAEGQITYGDDVGILELNERKWLINPWTRTPFGTPS